MYLSVLNQPYMKNKRIILSSVCCCLFILSIYVSCSGSKHTEKAINIVTTSILSTIVTTNQALVESTMYIYEIDSLKSGNPFYIHQFNISFISKTISFNLQLDSIEATWVKDSIMQFRKVTLSGNRFFYDELIIPNHNFPVMKDSILINIKCEYLPNMNILGYNGEFRCFTAGYNINNKINLHLISNFKGCIK